jgi:hypothetical protein
MAKNTDTALEPVKAPVEALALLGLAEEPKVTAKPKGKAKLPTKAEPTAPTHSPAVGPLVRGPGGKFLPREKATGTENITITKGQPVKGKDKNKMEEPTVIVEEPTEAITGEEPKSKLDEELEALLARDDMENGTPTLPILQAVNSLWADIRLEHPEVPRVVVVLGAKGRKKSSLTHGHFHASQWVHGEDKEIMHEVMLSGESLSRGAEATLGTLIHEAAHARAHVTGVQDTSNNGRYHNKRFKAIAESMGVSLTEEPTRGWTTTVLAEGTAEKYKDGLDKLRAVLRTYRRDAVEAAPKKPRNSTKVKIDCDCQNEVSVSKIWFESHGELMCGDCLTAFRQVD